MAGWGGGLGSRAAEFAQQRSSLGSRELDSASMWSISIGVTSSERGCGVEACPEHLCEQPGSAGTRPQAAQRCRGLGMQQPGSSLLPLYWCSPAGCDTLCFDGVWPEPWQRSHCPALCSLLLGGIWFSLLTGAFAEQTWQSPGSLIQFSLIAEPLPCCSN